MLLGKQDIHHAKDKIRLIYSLYMQNKQFNVGQNPYIKTWNTL